jgi:multicomponent Na+:H+ antiporter subunit G
MHAATKPQVLGSAVGARGRCDPAPRASRRRHADPGGLSTIITAPVVANRVGQLAYREHSFRDDLMTTDEMAEHDEK